MARTERAAAAVGQPRRARRGRGRARPARHRRARRPPHPRALRRPAAADVHRPRAAPRPDLLLLDEPTSGVDVRTRHEMLHLLEDLNATASRSCSPPTTSTASPPTCPHLVCLNRAVIGAGRPRRGAHARRPRAHVRRAHGGARARRDAGRRRLPVATPPIAHVHGRRSRDRPRRARSSPYAVRVLPQRPDRRDARGRAAAASSASTSCCKGMSYIGHGLSHAIFGGFAASALLGVNYFLGAGVWGLASALVIGGVTRRRGASAPTPRSA